MIFSHRPLCVMGFSHTFSVRRMSYIKMFILSLELRPIIQMYDRSSRNHIFLRDFPGFKNKT